MTWWTDGESYSIKSLCDCNFRYKVIRDMNAFLNTTWTLELLVLLRDALQISNRCVKIMLYWFVNSITITFIYHSRGKGISVTGKERNSFQALCFTKGLYKQISQCWNWQLSLRARRSCSFSWLFWLLFSYFRLYQKGFQDAALLRVSFQMA